MHRIRLSQNAGAQGLGAIKAMDRQLIKALIDALQVSDLAELEYSKDGATLRLTKASAPALPALAMRIPVSAPSEPEVPRPGTGQATDLIVASLYGIVHLQRTPGDPPFISAGQSVQAGQVLCTIEAMKVFTDVRADRPGTVAEILVTNGQEVEAGQSLVRLS